MPKACPSTGCKTDQAWAIVRDGKIHRVTFSKSLAQHILSKLTPDYRVARVRLGAGHRLQPGETSRTGFYAICKSGTGWTLRVTLFKELAESFTAHPSRHIRECFVTLLSDQPSELPPALEAGRGFAHTGAVHV